MTYERKLIVLVHVEDEIAISDLTRMTEMYVHVFTLNLLLPSCQDYTRRYFFFLHF